MTDLSELRNSANETARVARGNLLLFPVVGLHLGLLIVWTDDVLLLTVGRIDLPLTQIGVPTDTCTTVAPSCSCSWFRTLAQTGLQVVLSRLHTRRSEPGPARAELKAALDV